MRKKQPRRFDLTSLAGVPIAIGAVLLAQALEGGHARSLWQPSAALIVFGGTLGAIVISFSLRAVLGTVWAVATSFFSAPEPVEGIVKRLVGYAVDSRRRGLGSLENELERTEGFLRNALSLVVDGAGTKATRQILEVENQARRTADELPADVLESAAGYTPTLGILGAVLGLIHVMESLSDPAVLGSGIAVAFVATVYGVAAANLLLLPLATKLRVRAYEQAVGREIVIEAMVALQEGLNARLIDQQLRSYVSTSPVPAPAAKRIVAAPAIARGVAVP